MSDLTVLEVVLISAGTCIALAILGAGIGFWLFDKPRYEPNDQ